MFLYTLIPLVIMIFSTVIIVKRLLKISSRLENQSFLNSKVTFNDKKSCSVIISNKNPAVALNDNNIRQSIKVSHSSNLFLKSNEKQTQLNLKYDKKTLIKTRLRNFKQIYRLLLCVNLMFFVLVVPLTVCNLFDFLSM